MTRALVATSHVNLMEYPTVVRSFQKFPGDGSPASIGDSPKFPGDDPFLSPSVFFRLPRVQLHRFNLVSENSKASRRCFEEF